MMRVTPLAFGLILGLCSAALPMTANAQQTGKVFRVGVLVPRATDADSLKKELQVLGYVEGRNLSFDIQASEGKNERLPQLAADMASRKPDAIVTGNSAMTRAARQATATIPIVFAFGADPVGSGFVSSLARPGGNITGVTDLGVELAAKSIDLIRAIVPTTKRVGVLISDEATGASIVRSVEEAGAPRGVKVIPAMDKSSAELVEAFALLSRERADALIVPGGAVQASQRDQIAELAIKAKLPTIFRLRYYVEAGGFMSYGPSGADNWRLAASHVDKILKGANPADLPVQQPTKLRLVINLKTAKALGITVPDSVLLQADEVIQ